MDELFQRAEQLVGGVSDKVAKTVTDAVNNLPDVSAVEAVVSAGETVIEVVSEVLSSS
jgi:hypothetical protein